MTAPESSLRGAALLLPLALAAPAAGQGQDPRIKTVAVAGNVHMLVGNGGNVGVSVGEDGAFLVDDQFAPMVGQIKAAVAKLTDKPVKFVVNTHWHGDHTGGNERFGKAGAVIVAHANVRKRMSVEQFMKAFDRKVPPSPAAALPVITFTTDVTLHWNGDEIHVFAVGPAHTDGDAVVWFKQADAVHMGDVFFNGFYPFIDVGSGGTIRGMIAAVDRVLAICGPKTKIIPGHGPLADRAALLAYREMLAGVRESVAALVAEGKTADEVIASKPTARWDADWGNGFLKPDRFVAIVRDSVAIDRRDEQIETLGIRNFGRPLPGLVTAGQLTPEQFDALRRLGYHLVSLRAAGERGAGWEEERAGGEGFVRLPIEGTDALSAESARRLAGEMKAAGDAPVCVYCGSSNRVGVLIGLKAHFVDGLSPVEALALGEAAGATRYKPVLAEKLGQ